MALNKITTLGFAIALLATTFSAHAMEEFQPETEFQKQLLASKKEISSRLESSNNYLIKELNSPSPQPLSPHVKRQMIQIQENTISECHQRNLKLFQTFKKFNDEEQTLLLTKMNGSIERFKKYLATEAPEEERKEVTQAINQGAAIKATLEANIASDDLFYQQVVRAITEEYEAALASFLAHI